MMMMLVAITASLFHCVCVCAHVNILTAQGLDIPSCSSVIQGHYTITSHNADIPKLCVWDDVSTVVKAPPHLPAPNLPISSLGSLLSYAIPCGHHLAVCSIIMHTPCGTVSTHKISAECAAYARQREAWRSHNT